MVDYRKRKLRKYQNDFTLKFAQIMSEKLPEWKKIQNEKRWSLCSIKSLLTYFGVSLLGYVPGKREYNYDLQFHFYASIVIFIIAVIVNIDNTNKRYQNTIKSTLFPKLVKVFGDEIYYLNEHAGSLIYDLGEKYIKKMNLDDYLTELDTRNFIIDNADFENSQLYDHIITSRTGDDRFYGKYNDIKFVINETDFGWNSNDKHNTYHSMFKGVAMKFFLNKEIKNRVLITSKSIFNKIPKEFEKVNVEYNKFNEKYNVYVNDNGDTSGSGQIEARYLLNTAFLERFMQLHISFSVPKIQCSIYGTNMLIMLSTNKDLFEMNHLFGRIDDTNQYKHLFEEFASVLFLIDILNLSSKTKL